MSPTPLAGVPRVPPSPAPHRQRFGRGGGVGGGARTRRRGRVERPDGVCVSNANPPP